MCHDVRLKSCRHIVLVELIAVAVVVLLLHCEQSTCCCIIRYFNLYLYITTIYNLFILGLRKTVAKKQLQLVEVTEARLTATDIVNELTGRNWHKTPVYCTILICLQKWNYMSETIRVSTDVCIIILLLSDNSDWGHNNKNHCHTLWPNLIIFDTHKKQFRNFYSI